MFKSLSLSFMLALFMLGGVLSSAAQVQVRNEPRHHNVFENDWVRILDVHIPPGDTTLFHKHSTPSVFLVLSNTKTGSEVLQEPKKINLTDGNIWFEGFYDQARIHRVWNSDNKEFHVIDMELPAKDHQAIDAPLDTAAAAGARHFKLLFDENPVRAYRLALKPHASFGIGERTAPIVIIGLADLGNDGVNVEIGHGTAQSHTKLFSKKGDYLFVQPSNTIHLINKGGADEEFALFELK